MKCTNCGNNNASYHYSYNINGRVTEAHLCPECAAKENPELAAAEREFDSAFSEMESFFNGFDNLLGGGFFGGLFPALTGFAVSPAGSLAPARRVSVRQRPAQTEEVPQTQRTSVDPELSQRRELNALRAQMRAAAEREDYEEAARLRDELRRRENKE